MSIFQLFRSLTKLWKKNWLRIPMVVIGLLCLFGAIWFALPMTGVLLMATVWFRAAVIGGILLVILLVLLWRLRRRRRAAQQLEESLTETIPGDEGVLSEKMQEALAKLKKAGGKTYLYDLPWYIIIGPPGAGKTTALRNSQIEFPGTKMDAVEGFGGTKACDWWFAEDAVLIDTAGRYVTQDSDAASDAASWESFLDILKRGRPNQPINGVILAFPVDDIMTPPPGHLEAQAEIVRERLNEIHKVLKVDFPVYVMFTKADMIAGFREYFSSLTQARRKLVWGATFQTKDRSAETYKQVIPEFDALVQRLSDEIIDRMSEEPDGISRISIFGLPGQMALMRANIEEFLRRIFEPSRYKTNAILRGFYFTSGTQEGTPIDQVLGAMSRNDEDGGSGFQPAFMSGRGKSFFLHDLLTRVVFAERDWVSFDARSVRRQRILRGLALSVILMTTFGALGAFGYSYWQNTRLLSSARDASAAYFRMAQDELNLAVLTDPDPTPIMNDLQAIRMMTAGYGDERAPDMWEGMGLGQYRRTHTAAVGAYSDALERLLRPRLILHIENTLPALVRAGDTAEIYRALKVYITLGRQQVGQPDDAAIKSYFGEIWRLQFSNVSQVDERDQLEAHLAAMLELDDDRTDSPDIDAELIRAARVPIANLPLYEQAYAAIKDRASVSGVGDFDFVNALGGQVSDVFETKDGSPLADLRVPAMYTFEGYWGFYLEEMSNARQRLEDDRWVLGEEADRVDYDRQLTSLENDLNRMYQNDFEAAWNALLDNLSFKPLANDPPNYQVLANAASSTNSPILDLVEAVDSETRLPRLLDQLDSIDPSAAATGDLGGALGDALFQRLYARGGMLQRVLIGYLRDSGKVQDRAGGLEEDSLRRRTERIAAPFETWHAMLSGNPGSRPIDAILANLMAVRDNRRQAATSPNPAVDEPLLQQALLALTGNNSALPPELGGLLNEAVTEFRTVAEDATLADLNRALNDTITQFCNENITPYFPFGEGRFVPTSLFGQFFGPTGRMETFFNTYVGPHVLRTSEGFVADDPLGERFSPQLLASFAMAERIKLAFFDSTSPDPAVGMSITHKDSPGTELAILTINGNSARTRPGGPAVPMDWPGSGQGVTLEVFPADAGRDSTRSFNGGPWAIVNLLRQGSARVSGPSVDLTLNVGGRTLSYNILFDSTTTPFLMTELADFTCPVSIE